MRGARVLLLALPLAAGTACDGWTDAAPPPAPAAPPAGAVPQGDAARRAALAPPGPAVDAALLARGAERYAIFCAPCHGARGVGDGPVVARGFPRPPDIAGAEAGRSMAAIATNLGGAHPFDDRLAPADRWAIARVLERGAPPAPSPGAPR